MGCISQHIENWIKINVFHNQPLIDGYTEWIQKFCHQPGAFKVKVRAMWKTKKLSKRFGNSEAVDKFLKTIIEIPFVCNCSSCTGDEDVEMEDVGPDLDADL